MDPLWCHLSEFWQGRWISVLPLPIFTGNSSHAHFRLLAPKTRAVEQLIKRGVITCEIPIILCPKTSMRSHWPVFRFSVIYLQHIHKFKPHLTRDQTSKLLQRMPKTYQTEGQLCPDRRSFLNNHEPFTQDRHWFSLTVLGARCCTPPGNKCHPCWHWGTSCAIPSTNSDFEPTTVRYLRVV